jgi:G:T/U-mismatch repair DNA glycosylase
MNELGEVHPYNLANPIPEGTRILIVGTAPPERFSRAATPLRRGDVRFYYGSEDNELWSIILSTIFRVTFEHEGAEVKRRDMIAFLTLNRIWMHDIFEVYERRRAGSSLDSNLQLLQAADFKRVLSDHPTIQHIIFTGTKAERETCRYLVQWGLIGTIGVFGRMPRSRSIVVDVAGCSRTIRFHAVPSPSAMTKRSGMTGDEKLAIYRQVFREALPDALPPGSTPRYMNASS